MGGRPDLANSTRALRAVAANAALRRIQLALLWSSLGRWAHGPAIALLAVERASVGGVGLALALPLLAAALAAPVVSVIVDRFPRSRVMVGVDLARIACALAIALAAMLALPLAVIVFLASLSAIASTLDRPASRALLPALARTPEELTAANAVSSGIQSASIVLGPALAGVLSAATDESAVFVVCAALFGTSAVLVALLPRELTATGAPKLARLTLGEALAGLRTVHSHPVLRLLVGLFAAQTLVGGALNVFVIVVGNDLLGLGDSGIGLLLSAVGVGGLLGTLAAAGLGGSGNLAGALVIGLVMWSLPLVLVGAWPALAVMVAALLMIGVADVLVDVSVVSLIQRSAPDEVLGRVFGVLESTLLAMVGVGALLAPLVIEMLGLRPALLLFGALLPALVALCWPALAALEEAVLPPGRIALLRSQPIFAPLSESALAALAARLRPVTAAAGEIVIRQGEPGDRYYLIENGTVEIAIDGKTVATQGPGEGFGEVALVRDIPRIATVTAHGPARLFALERDVFVSAVTGHPASAAAANAVAAARLAPRPLPLSSP